MSNDDNNDNKHIKTDYEFSRETYYDIIEKGAEGINEMLELAKQTEHPRSYEVLSKLINDVANATDKLMDLNKKHKDITRPDPKELPAPDKRDALMFVGTTADLQRMLAQPEKEVGPLIEDS